MSGTWTVPSLSCPKKGTTYVAIWVGIDGYSSSTVEQTGILGECSHGSASYAAWYEFYPSQMYTFSQAVKSGDTVTASVSYVSGTFSVALSVDGGTPNHASSQVASALRTSAEWIVERPALCSGFSCQLTTLADFTSAGFSSASATVGGVPGAINVFSDVAITMVGGSSGPVLAEPSSLSTSGSDFSVAYG